VALKVFLSVGLSESRFQERGYFALRPLVKNRDRRGRAIASHHLRNSRMAIRIK